ncbi:hypothetical protein G5I_10281 [Acromyrmex echinatior]|uniref:Uncharacterized protein n=1 Tax=Acromyrmex echinatior TaxID=103372 RepID=F4WWG4_ACREC|nr:hypothetical protein G5I_10281 [Acromyrmex echinatior]
MPDKKERRGEKKRSHPPLTPAFLFPDFFSRGWKEEKRRVEQIVGMAEVPECEGRSDGCCTGKTKKKRTEKKKGDVLRKREEKKMPSFLDGRRRERKRKREERKRRRDERRKSTNGKRDERESRGNSNYASLAAKATDACSAISVLPRAANIRRQPPKWTTG